MDPRNHDEHARQSGRGKWVLVGFLAVAAYFLWAEHQAHLMGALPYLLLLACPLMHLFHHGGHGHHRVQHGQHGQHEHHERSGERSSSRPRTGEES